MSTLRITNIEAKADPSSPTVDEKIKLTNSNGDILVHIDGKTSGITTIGINTTAGNIKFDQNSNVVVTGIITATKFVGTIEPTSLEIGSNIKLGNAGVITATSYVGDGSALTGIDATQIQTGNTSVQTVDTGSDGHVKITTEGTERLRIDSSGNLNLVSSSSSLTDLNFTDSTLNVYARVEGGKSGSGVGDLRFHTYSGGLSEAARITSAGRMLFGTTTVPTGLVLGNSLTAASSTGAEVVAFRSDTSVAVGDKCGAFVIGNSDTDGVEDHFVGMWGKVASTNGSMNLHFAAGRASYEGDNPDVTIKSGGNLGVGTASPSYKVDLDAGSTTSGGLRVSGSSSPQIRIEEGSGVTASLQADGATGYVGTISNNNFVFRTNATERMRIDTSGRVGISQNTFADARESLIVGSVSGQSSTFQIIKSSSTNGNAALYFGDSDNNYRGGVIYANSNDELSFRSAGNEAMRILSSGNVGINNTAPADKLHVGGNIRFGTNTTYYGVIEHEAGVTGSNIYTSKDTGGHIFKTGTTPTEKVRIDNDGRLLVGTTTEGYSSADTLTVAESGNAGITIRSGTSNLGTIAFSDATSGAAEYSGYIQYNQGNRHLEFGTAEAGRVRIDPNGHLEVNYDSSNNARVQFGYSSGVWITGNASDGHQRFYTNSGERIRSGYNGQGTDFYNQNSVRPGADNSIDLGSGSNRWDDVYATNGTIQTSDSRLKQEVVTSVLGIDFVKALRPVSYKWIEGKKVPIVDGTDENGDNVYRTDDDNNWIYESRAGARRHWGFIAQEVKQAVDDAGVDFAGWSLADKDDPDSRQSLRYEEFIAPLTKALQEAIAKIETLESQVTALQGS